MNTEEMVAELFDIFDRNRDGFISRGEFVELAECLLHQKGFHFSSDIFDEFDTNHDNRISRKEMVDMVIDLAL
jgi:Ca2+-binding EF-hand superfamily protein